jgi:hypothetical protein
MRRLLGKVAPVLALAIVVIASVAPARPAHAMRAHATSVATHVQSGDVARLDATTSSGPRSSGPAQNATDPATDPDQDTLGSEREAPEALPAFGGIGLVAPHASRAERRSTHVEDAVYRAVLPAVQPPRG